MPQPLQRMPLELGLDLDINQLLRDGFIEPGQMTPLREYHWLGDDGDVKACAKIAADITRGSTLANAARYGTMNIVADWIDQTIQLIACPRHFGGQQWYFVCPRKNQYVSVLWSPPGQRFFAGLEVVGQSRSLSFPVLRIRRAGALYGRQALRPHRRAGGI